MLSSSLKEESINLTEMLLLMSFCVGDMFPYLRWLDVLTGFIPNLKALSEELDTYLDQIIQEHRDLKIQDEFSNKKDCFYLTPTPKE
ncbi:hypothetical protein PTKIN_Ptkin04bG0040200 [Pterospermum kingtungense]